jgi:hypothetical protein
VAIAITSTASATHHHQAGCPSNCSDKMAAVPSSAKSFEQKVADLKNVAAEKTSLINYNRSMQQTLNLVAKQKHEEAIANIESENAYNNLMAGIITEIEQHKVENQLEDLNAAERFSNMMQSIFTETASN